MEEGSLYLVVLIKNAESFCYFGWIIWHHSSGTAAAARLICWTHKSIFLTSVDTRPRPS